MAATFTTMKADYDSAQREGHWRSHLGQFFDRTTADIGRTTDDFSALTMPTLLLVGDRDMFCPVEVATAAYRMLPAGELAVVPNTGHDIAPRVIDTISDFWRTASARSSSARPAVVDTALAFHRGFVKRSSRPRSGHPSASENPVLHDAWMGFQSSSDFAFAFEAPRVEVDHVTSGFPAESLKPASSSSTGIPATPRLDLGSHDSEMKGG